MNEEEEEDEKKGKGCLIMCVRMIRFFFCFYTLKTKIKVTTLLSMLFVCLFELSFLIFDVDDWLFTINQKCEQKFRQNENANDI